MAISDAMRRYMAGEITAEEYVRLTRVTGRQRAERWMREAREPTRRRWWHRRRRP